VLIRFPFSDLSSAKLRPAIILAAAGRGDLVLCQVTSNPYADDRAIELGDEVFAHGGLRRRSYVRPGKLFTLHQGLIVREVGTLHDSMSRRIVDAVVALLRGA